MPTRRDTNNTEVTRVEKGPSLARGPAWIVGLVLAAFGLILFFKVGGTPLKTSGFPNGQAVGVRFLGFEVNGWSAWLTTAAGVVVLAGAAQHVVAKTLSLIVGLALGAASVIALVDGRDVLGLAAANGLTALAWGVAATILIVTALLPRVGRRRDTEVSGRDTAATSTSVAGTGAARDREQRHGLRDHEESGAMDPDGDRTVRTEPVARRHERDVARSTAPGTIARERESTLGTEPVAATPGDGAVDRDEIGDDERQRLRPVDDSGATGRR